MAAALLLVVVLGWQAALGPSQAHADPLVDSESTPALQPPDPEVLRLLERAAEESGNEEGAPSVSWEPGTLLRRFAPHPAER